MINLTEVYDLISQAFHETQDYFKWGDNAVIQGSLKNLPSIKDKVKSFSVGDYFALIDVSSITPEDAGSGGLFQPHYSYSVILCHVGKVGDITKLRNDMVNKFAEGWYKFWSNQYPYKENTDNIFDKVDEIEADFDLLCCQFDGTISHITRRGGAIND